MITKAIINKIDLDTPHLNDKQTVNKLIDMYKKTIKMSSNAVYTKSYNNLVNRTIIGNRISELFDVEAARFTKTHFKIVEYNKYFDKFDDMSTFIDFGAAPGSWDAYMLSRGMTGIGVTIENKKIRQKINYNYLDEYIKSNKFKFVTGDVFKIKPNTVFGELEAITGKQTSDIIVCDIGKGGDNGGMWDSYNSNPKTSDTVYHDKILSICFDYYTQSSAKSMMVKMFNINQYGLLYEHNKVDSVFDDNKQSKDTTYEILKKIHDDHPELFFYTFKPVSSNPINNEYYLVISKIDHDHPVTNWDEFLLNLTSIKYNELKKVLVYQEFNISTDVINRSLPGIDDIAKNVLHNDLGQPNSYQQAITPKKKPKKKKRRRVRK